MTILACTWSPDHIKVLCWLGPSRVTRTTKLYKVLLVPVGKPSGRPIKCASFRAHLRANHKRAREESHALEERVVVRRRVVEETITSSRVASRMPR